MLFSHQPDRDFADAQHVGSRFFLDAEPSENPYLLHIVPMASTVPPVRFALASQASCHLATRFGDHRLFEQSLRLRITAINLLRQRLHDPIPSQAPGSLAAIQLLAQLDVGHCTLCLSPQLTFFSTVMPGILY